MTLEELAARYGEVWAELLAEQERLADPRTPVSRARLMAWRLRVDEAMDELDELSRQWAVAALSAAYAQGARSGLAELGIAAGALTAVDVRVVETIAGDLLTDLSAATRTARRSGANLVARLLRQDVDSSLPVQEAARRMAQELRRHGLTAMVYRNGSRHGLDEYAEMALRTKRAVAHNAGVLNVARRHGATHVEVTDGFGCGWFTHDDPDKAHGTVRTVEEAATAAIAHPRCQRVFHPVRERVAS